MKKTFSFLLLFIIIIAQAQSITPKNNIIFNEDFGSSDVRLTSDFVPQSGRDATLGTTNFSHGSKFYKFAEIVFDATPNKNTENRRSNTINDGYYAIIKPQSIYSQLSQEYLDKVPPAYKWWLLLNGDSTSNNNIYYNNGNVLVINAGAVLNQFYRRAVSLERGKTYTISADIFAVKSKNISLRFEAQNIASEKMLGTSDPLKVNKASNWETISWSFTTPMDSKCNPNISVSIRNLKSLESGNDFYIDNIKLVEGGVIGDPIACNDDSLTTIIANDDYGVIASPVVNSIVKDLNSANLNFISNDLNNNVFISNPTLINFYEQLDQKDNFKLEANGTIKLLKVVKDGKYEINYIICNTIECSRAKVFVTVGDDVEIVPDIDGDGIPDNIDLDNDNDGILDIDEGIGGSCISGLNGDLNEEVWSFNGFDVTVDTGSQYSPTQYEPNSPIEAVRGSEISYSFSEIAKNVSFKISELNEGEVIKVRFKNNGKIVPINSYNLIKSSSSITTSISQGELTLRALQVGNEENIIVKSGFDFIDRIELVFTTETPPFIGDNVIPTAVYDFEGLCYGPDLDTDGDGIPDYLDTDSDGDGCPDALEAAVRGGKIIIANLDSKGSIIGDVDNNGVPVLANGGNGVGSSKDVAISVCKTLAHCTNSATSLGAFEESVVGISTFSTTANAFINGDSTTKQRESWPKLVKNAYLHLDTGNKGFIITNAIAEDIKEPLPGMLIYDTKDKCIKLRNGKEWKCIKSTCDITNNY